MSEKIKSYIIGIAIPLAVGLLSAFFTRNNMDLYETVVKPALAPPGIVFPIVWTVLYVLMGIGSAIIYNSDAAPEDKSQAILLYGVQLIFNFFWSVLFFNNRAFLFSFFWLLVLWGLILAMIVSFGKIDRTAAKLQIPYLLWVTFAGYLNGMVYLLNR